MANKMMRLWSVQSSTGKSRSSIYKDINKGLFPPPVLIGARAKAWPESEVIATNQAWVSGKTPDEIRTIILKMIAERTKNCGGAE